MRFFTKKSGFVTLKQSATAATTTADVGGGVVAKQPLKPIIKNIDTFQKKQQQQQQPQQRTDDNNGREQPVAASPQKVVSYSMDNNNNNNNNADIKEKLYAEPEQPNGSHQPCISKRNITSILRCTTFLNSNRKNESTDTASTTSETTNGSTTDEDANVRIRPVLITVARNRPAAEQQQKKVQKKEQKKEEETVQYSPDILNAPPENKYESPIRRTLLRFLTPNRNNDEDDSNSIVEDSFFGCESTAFGADSTTAFGAESTIGESTTFGESILGESTIGDSVYTNMNETSTLDYSFGATEFSDMSASRSRNWRLPAGSPRIMHDVAGVVQDIVEDMSSCGSYLLRSSEDFICGEDEELKEEYWREMMRKRQQKSERIDRSKNR